LNADKDTMADSFPLWLDAMGPLGFKVLSMEENGVRSALAAFTWEGPLVRMAACSRCGALALKPDCTCGLHASYSAGHVLDQYAQYRERFLVLVEGQGRVILHEYGWRAEYCAVHAIIELYASNIVKHMQLLRASRCLGDPRLMTLEDAIGIVQACQRSYLHNGDWQASWRTDPGARTAASQPG
jgi:hypothetical protein